jgi:hypothetical protein
LSSERQGDIKDVAAVSTKTAIIEGKTCKKFFKEKGS